MSLQLFCGYLFSHVLIFTVHGLRKNNSIEPMNPKVHNKGDCWLKFQEFSVFESILNIIAIGQCITLVSVRLYSFNVT